MKTKMMFAALAFAAAATFVSCGNNKQADGNAEAEQAEAAAPAALSIDDVLAQADSLAGQEVVIEGVCTHACKHGATKIFLMGSDDTKTIRVEAGALGAFDPACVNAVVNVVGTLVEERIDEAYLLNWEEQLKNIPEQHGDGEAGCDTEKKARGETGNTPQERIAAFRTKIAEQKAATGKDYLSFYYVEAKEYKVVE